MILHLKAELSAQEINQLSEKLNGQAFKMPDKWVMVLSSSVKELNAELNGEVEASFVMDSDIQLASKQYMKAVREVKVGTKTLGGSTNNTLMIAGPCSVESEAQMRQTAALLKEMNITALRGGCYKPRTSPYSFQGMGLEGLKLMAAMRDEFGFDVVTEVRDATHVDHVIEYADVVQVGAKAMYDQGILKACGASNKTVLLKRGFGTTLQEFVQAAEFVLSGGNPNVILCERGIRTFVKKTRFTLDLCGVAWLKEHVNLPIILDPSHAMGYRYGVPDLTRACMAMGVDGLIIETHPNPKEAKSDAAQQLDHDQFKSLYNSLAPIGNAIGRNLV